MVSPARGARTAGAAYARHYVKWGLLALPTYECQDLNGAGPEGCKTVAAGPRLNHRTSGFTNRGRCRSTARAWQPLSPHLRIRGFGLTNRISQQGRSHSYFKGRRDLISHEKERRNGQSGGESLSLPRTASTARCLHHPQSVGRRDRQTARRAWLRSVGHHQSRGWPTRSAVPTAPLHAPR